MGKEINLLPKQKQNFLQKEQTVRISQIIGFGSLILSVTFTIFLFFLAQNNDIPRLESQQKSLESNLTLLHEKAAQYLFLSDRITKIQKILKMRSDFSLTLSQVEKLIPQSVTVQSLNLDKKDISLVVTSDSLTSMGVFIDQVTTSVKNKVLLKHVTFDDVIANPVKGTYTLSIRGELL